MYGTHLTYPTRTIGYPPADDQEQSLRWWLPHPRRRDIFCMFAVALVVGMLCALAPRTAYGAEIREGDTVVVPPDETINDDLYAFGQTVTIQGTVNGDVIAGGQTINVTGTVAGDVLAAGQTVNISGPVSGGVRLAGQTVDIMAPVNQDVVAGTSTLTVGPQGQVGRDILVGGGSVVISGPVGRTIRAGAGQMTIAAPVGGDVLAQVGSLRLANGASIAGDLTYTSAEDAVVESGATVSGLTTRHEAPAAPAAPSPAARFGAAALGWFMTLFGFLVYSLLLVALFPQFSWRSVQTLVQSPWASLGLGFAVLVGVPIAALVIFGLGLLIGGWWIGALVLALYLVLVPLGFTIVALYLGRLILARAGRPTMADVWQLLVGLVLLGLVSLIPIAGPIAMFVVLLFGLGALVMELTTTYRARPIANDERASHLPHDHAHGDGAHLPA